MNVQARVTTIGNVVVIAFVLGYFVVAHRGTTERESRAPQSDRILLSDDEWTDLTLSGSVLGNPDGREVVVEFMDYECQFCVSSHRAVERFLDNSPNAMVVVRHLPLPMHRVAERAARAAICAEVQRLFQAMHERLVSSEDWHTDNQWGELAAEIGITRIDEFVGCLDSDETTGRLRHDGSIAAEVGVRMTPTFVSRLRIHEGSVGFGSLPELVRDGPERK